MAYLKFPKADRNILTRRGGHYMGAAVCRRGHVVTSRIDLNDPHPNDTKCVTCGADVLIGCPSCGLRVRGDWVILLSIREEGRPAFCDGCGVAHPWATRRERIFELENLLDQEDLDEADRLFVHERLRELREAEDLDDRRERQLWSQIRDRAGGFLTSEPVKKITETLVTAAVRNQLKI